MLLQGREGAEEAALGPAAGRQDVPAKYTRTPLLLQPLLKQEANIAVTFLENERISILTGGHNGSL